ncbi:ATP-binding protein [Flavobacteriaceae bacterium MHTCC 0001]
MKERLLLILLIFNLFCGFSQTRIADSLKLELTKQSNDSVTGTLYRALIDHYLFSKVDSSFIYIHKLDSLADITNSLELKAVAIENLGSANFMKSKLDSAAYYYEKAIKVYEKAGIPISSIYTNLGLVHKFKGDYKKSLETYLKGYSADLENKSEYGQFMKLLNIADLYNVLGDENNFLEYAKKATEIGKSTDNVNILKRLGSHLNNIGTHYLKLKEFDTAITYYNKALKLNFKYENKNEIGRNYNNLGSAYIGQGKPEKALGVLKKALKVREEFGVKKAISEVHRELGVVYGKLNDKPRSKFHFNKALLLAKESNDLLITSRTYLEMSEIYSLWNDTKSALDKYKKYTLFKDSIFNKDHQKNMDELKVKYETERKDKELVQQDLEIEKQASEIQKKKAQNRYIIAIAAFLLISSILLWFLYKQNQKRKDQEILGLKREQQVKTLESLIEGEEKERLRVAKELHDGVNVDLSAIKYKLTSLIETNNAVINEAVAMIDKSCEQVRAISHNLVPPALKDFTLVETLQDYCSTTNAIHNEAISFQCVGSIMEITKKAEVNIFRIVQELVNNSLKHAEASEIDVQISYQESDTIQLTVEDNGKGFDVNAVNKDGIGLQNINSRIAYLNAKLDVKSDSKGTSYIIDIKTNDISC